MRTSAPPNIVLLHWHDVGRRVAPYEDHGWTPTLRSLAARSVVFDQAFCTAPVCTPARGSLFTGMHPHRNGLMGLAHLGWRYHPGQQTLAHLLGAAGYHTALVGLQHESQDAGDLGFDEIFQDDTLAPPGMGGHLREHEAPQYCGPVAKLARRFLLGRRHPGGPFFASIGFWEVHRPYPPERYQPVDPASVPVPAYLADRAGVRHDLAGFFGATHQADAAVGVVLEALVEAGLDENTWVVFTTDHGEAFPRAKGTLYDPGLGVALMVRPPPAWTGPRRRVDALVSHVDVLPSLLELAGAAIPDGLDGVSLVPLLEGGAGRVRPAVFAQQNWHDPDNYDPMRCIRTPDFKYIRNYGDLAGRRLPGDVAASSSVEGMRDDVVSSRSPVELYDLRHDPHELHNVAGRWDYAEIEAALASELDRWRIETADPLLRGAIPDPHGHVPASGAR